MSDRYDKWPRIVDDPWDDDQTVTPEDRAKIDEWFKRVFKKRLERGQYKGPVIVIASRLLEVGEDE
jgi:hypothetical protein